jgi:hypothetical protein
MTKRCTISGKVHIATEAAIAKARIAGEPVVIQEVGGFSVVGRKLFFLPRKPSCGQSFIEPSFRGCMSPEPE